MQDEKIEGSDGQLPDRVSVFTPGGSLNSFQPSAWTNINKLKRHTQTVNHIL